MFPRREARLFNFNPLTATFCRDRFNINKKGVPMRSKIIVSCVGLLLAANGAAFARSWRVSGAVVHMRKGEYQAAIELLEEDVAKSPDNAQASGYLGDAYAYEGRFMAAARAWSRAEDIYIRKNKEKELERIDQSRKYFWSAAFNAARESFARALSFNKAEFVPPGGETVAGDLDKAEEGFVATYRVFDAHPKTLLVLGRVYEEKTEYYRGLDAEEPVVVTDYDLATGAATQRLLRAGEYAGEMEVKALDAYEAALGLKRADIAGPDWDKTTTPDDYFVKFFDSCLAREEYDRVVSAIEQMRWEELENPTVREALKAVVDKLYGVDEGTETPTGKQITSSPASGLS
jgi:hypothetical protein